MYNYYTTEFKLVAVTVTHMTNISHFPAVTYGDSIMELSKMPEDETNYNYSRLSAVTHNSFNLWTEMTR